MALSKDEQTQLDALTRKASEPDEEFDIEIWDETGAGAKVPYSKGRSWLNRFGIDLPTEPPETEPESEPKAPKARQPKAQPGPTTSNVTQRYFGKDNKAS